MNRPVTDFEYRSARPMSTLHGDDLMDTTPKCKNIYMFEMVYMSINSCVAKRICDHKSTSL